jgi:dipeptidase
VCDTLAVVTPTGTWFAKSSDRSPREEQVLELHAARPSGGTLTAQYTALPDPGAARVLASRPTWLRGYEHGVNEHRVAVGNERIWTTRRPSTEAGHLLGMDLVRIALERGTDADAALDALTAALERHGQGGIGEFDRPEAYDSSFLIVDPRGGWHVETRGSSWAAAPIGSGTAISNRVSLRAGWTRASADVAPGTDIDTWRHPRVDTAIADPRLAATSACVRGASAVDARTIVATLRDHGSGPWGAPGAPGPVSGPRDGGVSVCMHVDGLSTTTASMVAFLPADPDVRTRAWCALGSPCCSVYVPVDPADPPAALADPTTWRRFAALRDRALARPAVHAADRARLDALERALWAEDDASIEPPGDAGPRVLEALDALGV